ncbi:hypothetical protein SLS62_002669 [Diatrype stigma]|uniref:Uncharacterized protein n=1 Tax=Diatrype stigma TaxID=117547 RepID=A0AAN9UX23_9PEZI
MSSELSFLSQELKFFDRAQRPDTERPGYLFHFAFERECINGALLELITASVKQAKATGRRIYLDWNATTWNDAVCNLTAFSIDKGDRYDHATLEAEGLKVFPANGEDEATLKSINSCLGWMELDSDEVERELGPLRWEFPHYNREADEGVLDRDLPRGKVFCLVYRFVPEEGPMDLKYIMRQADFFHAVGFDFHGSEFKGNNWRGKGVLVDMSDIVSMNDRAWDDDAYAWYHKGFAKATEYTLGEMAEGLEFG